VGEEREEVGGCVGGRGEERRKRKEGIDPRATANIVSDQSQLASPSFPIPHWSAASRSILFSRIFFYQNIGNG